MRNVENTEFLDLLMYVECHDLQSIEKNNVHVKNRTFKKSVICKMRMGIDQCFVNTNMKVSTLEQ